MRISIFILLWLIVTSASSLVVKNNKIYIDVIILEQSEVMVNCEGVPMITVSGDTLSGNNSTELSFSEIAGDRKTYHIFSTDEKYNDQTNWTCTEKSFPIIESNKVGADTVRGYEYAESYCTYEEANSSVRKEKIQMANITEESNNPIEIQFPHSKKKVVGDIVLCNAEAYEIGGHHYEGEIRISSGTTNLRVVNRIELEEYIKGVVSQEIGDDVSVEAIKAQCVAARSTLLYKIFCKKHWSQNADICATTHCQTFKGFDGISPIISMAVEQTENEILVYQDKVIEALYSSYCGGMTESAECLWGASYPYLRSVSDNPEHSPSVDYSEESWITYLSSKPDCYCRRYADKRNKSIDWEKSIPKNALAKKLGLATIENIEVIKRGKSGRITAICVQSTDNDKVITKELNIRQAFGDLPSSACYFIINKDSIDIKGTGSGHGVGMCQAGAIEMAEEGFLYQEILQNYFPGTMITHIEIMR